MREVREMGLSIGLHTGGAYPRRLEQVLPLLDWVGLDIKAAPQDYREAAGFDGGAKAWRALDLVLDEERARREGADPFGYEVRLTVFPGAPAERDFPRFLSLLRQVGVEYFALQEARTQGTDEIFQAMAERWDMPRWRSRYEEMAGEARGVGFTSVDIR